MANLSVPAKWQILLTVLPLTALYGAVKVALHRLGWEPWAFDSLTGSLFGAATFVIAFVLNGTLGDFRASADMPMQLAKALETIQDSNQLVARANAEYDPAPLTQDLLAIAQTTLDWLQSQQPQAETAIAIDRLNTSLAAMLPYAGAPIVARAQAEQANVRLLLTQIGISRDTEFVGPAYVLLELFLIGAVAALLLIGADSFSENLVVSCLLFTSFTYLLLLIRDLDNPFQYDGRSSVEADLTTLVALRDRLQQG
ncbi:hypothetical protein [Nodosilinea nodulosa]|uniref:hypothetical protein n=1 Tax=Nodosilinea nodulosa TaxID=416001 RepID=UPI00037CF029|nr:hypothetical protein [Nodosilinea nodulosa]